MTPRFSFDPPAPHDCEIVNRATGLKIELYRDEDGDIHGDVELRCGFGLFGENKDPLASHEQKQADALQFVRRLLEAFERRRPDDALGGVG